MNLPLDPKFDLTKLQITSCKRVILSVTPETTYLLFLPAKLLFLETDALGSEFLGQDGRIADKGKWVSEGRLDGEQGTHWGSLLTVRDSFSVR